MRQVGSTSIVSIEVSKGNCCHCPYHAYSFCTYFSLIQSIFFLRALSNYDFTECARYEPEEVFWEESHVYTKILNWMEY
jgi:hypothetical protein